MYLAPSLRGDYAGSICHGTKRGGRAREMCLGWMTGCVDGRHRPDRGITHPDFGNIGKIREDSIPKSTSRDFDLSGQSLINVRRFSIVVAHSTKQEVAKQHPELLLSFVYFH